MPKPKVVTRERLDKGPTGSKANRTLTTMEKATSWVDEHGMISPEEGLRRVFEAATEGGTFTVCTKGARAGQTDVLRYRTYPQALAVYVHLFNQQRLPIMYCATFNRDAQLLPRRSYKGEDGWVPMNDATADEAQRLLDAWCRGTGVRNKPTAPLIDTMRTIRHKPIKRERL
jgi:hypothetical protein